MEETELDVSVEPPDILSYVSYGSPWTANNVLSAAFTGGLRELVASWLMGRLRELLRERLREDRGTNDFPSVNIRTFWSAVYAVFIELQASQALSSLLFRLFEHWTSPNLRLIQVCISTAMVRIYRPDVECERWL